MDKHSVNDLFRLFVLLLLVSIVTVGAVGANLQIPVARDALTIDGILDDPLWQKARVLRLESPEFGAPFPQGGETRIVVRGKYLCVSARLPEPDRIVAISVGRNPIWCYEDLVTWRFEDLVRSPGKPNSRRFFTLSVNPLGGARLDTPMAVGGGVPDRGAMVAVVTGDEDAAVWRSNSRLMFSVPINLAEAAKSPLVAARIGSGEWSVEAAIPLEPTPELGIMSIERIRVRRPEAPELRWYWPKPHLGAGFEVAVTSPSNGAPVPAPFFQPPVVGNQEPEIGVPKLSKLPPLGTGWADPVWQAATKLELQRDESNARPPGVPTEVRLAHDGRILSVLARCTQRPGSTLEDSLRVFISPSGANFAEFEVTEAGVLHHTVGATGPVRSRSVHASWKSSATVRTTKGQESWTARLNIPLDEVANALGEPSIPEEWRILIRRSRSGSTGSTEEISSVPVMQSPTPYAPARYRRLRLKNGATPDARVTPPRVQSGDKLTVALASIPSQVWSDEKRRTLGIDKMVEENLLQHVDKAAETEKREWEKITTTADWEAFRDQRLKALRESFGPFPERSPLRATVTRRANYGDGFVLENVVFESRPHLLVPANLYLPERIEGRVPAIIVVHNHHEAKTQPENQDMGMMWARQGAAVLVMDLIAGTERVQLNPWPHEPWGFSNYYSRYAAGIQLYLAGESLMKWFVWDLMRGVDLLLERPYIDPTRIGIVGQCSGGGDAAAVAAALDERIAVLVPDNFCGGTPMEHYRWGNRRYGFETMSPNWGEWEPTRSLRSSIAGQFFPWFICASVAPRGFIYNMEVAWPGGVEKQPPWARFRKVYELYGRRDLLDECDGFGPMPGPGETNLGGMWRQALYPILERWLGIARPVEEYHNPRPYSELMCVTPQIAAERKPKPVSEVALELARERLTAARSRYAAFSAEESRRLLAADLKAKLGDIEPDREAEGRAVWTKSASAFTVDALSLESADGIRIPMLLLKPKGVADERLPAVIALAHEGKERFLSNRGEELAALLRQRVAVCLPDVRGVGETINDAPPWYVKGSSTEKAWRSEDGHGARSMELPTVEFMLGRTILGSRLKDARTVFHYLARRNDIDPKRILLWGDSFAEMNPRAMRFYEDFEQQMGPQIYWQAEPLGSLLAVLTAFYEDGVRGVAARHGLASYLSVLGDRFCYVPMDVIVPGVLQVADVSDLVATLAPRSVLLEGLVNGRNQLLDVSELQEEMKTAHSAYRHTPERLVIREKRGEPELANWLVQQCSR